MTDFQVDAEQPFISHLLELRDRLLRSLAVVLVLLLALFPFGNDIYSFIAGPMMAVLPAGSTMIATQVASPFLTPFKLSLVAAVFLAMPYLLYQLWGFVAPGLYQHEKKLAMPLLASSVILFYLGAAFAFYVVFPLIFGFLTSMAPEGVAVMTDITHYLDFVLTLFFAFGAAFEVPIATILLVWMGMTTPQALKQKRPYIIVGAFVVGMFLTPPDVFSQTMLAVPMWILFEAGVFASRFFVRDDEDKDSDSLPDESEPVAQPTPQQKAAPVASVSSDPFVPEAVADSERYVPLTSEQMDAELDRIEAEEQAEQLDPVELKLARVNELRDSMDFDAARKLLYEVLVEGNDSQVTVAKNILAQLDED